MAKVTHRDDKSLVIEININRPILLIKWGVHVTPVTHRPCASASDPMLTPVTHQPRASASDPMLTPVTHQPRASASDPMRVRTCHNGYVRVDRAGRDQERTANKTEWFAPSDIVVDFQHMYISRRGDTVGPPVWKSIILHVFLKPELIVL